MEKEEAFAKCDALGLAGVKAEIESGRWAGKTERFAREWVQIEEGEREKADKSRQEEQHTEKIDTQLLSAKEVVHQMTATTTFMGKKMESLTVEVNTLDKRLNDLNTTIKKASNSSGKVAWALWILTAVIAGVAVIGLLKELKIFPYVA